MKYILLLILPFLFTGCVTFEKNISQYTGLTEEDINSVPKNVSKIFAINEEIEKAELYEQIVNVLYKEGYQIAKEDKDRFYLVTEPIRVGLTVTHRLTVLPVENGFEFRTEGRTSSTYSSFNTAYNNSDLTRLAFMNTYKIAKLVDCKIFFK